MPIDYTIDAAQGLIRTKVTGVVTLDELIENFDKQFNDPRYIKCTRELADVRDITPEITAEELRRYSDLVHRNVNKLPTLRIAVVVNDDLTYGMARMYSSLIEDAERDVEVFRSVADAEQWLETEPATKDPAARG